ncbi:MAG: hypothetical protein KGJ93_03245 [Patescibacteria group bacterium]|nr:hypothetical protein [Patescibacteria group bacterium]
MHKNTLRELAKFLSGLVAGDFLAAWWIWAKGLLPTSFMGIMFSQRGVIVGMVFDVILFCFLVHFGWRIKETPKDEERLFHRVAGTIFAIIAVLHLLRLFFGWQFNLFGWATPYWLSGIGTIVAAFLSYASFQLTKK